MRTIYANNLELILDKKESFLAADAAAAATAITVESIVGFAVNLILIIVDPGNEKTEIIKTHASTAPTGTTVTLASGLVFAHSQGTKIYIIDWDQVEFSHAATITGTKSVLATIAIQADQTETIYKDTAQTSGYYFIRFKNTIDTSYSDYSDPIPYGGYTDNTLGKAIAYALKRNKTEYTDNVDHDFMVEEANLCLQYARGELKKWHQLQSFDYILGQTSRGIYKFALPSDAWQYSNKSVLGFRIGDGENLTYYDKTEWETELEGVEHTTLAADAAIGATSITLTNSYDFEDSGTVMIKGQEITYTANNRATGVLSGIPASGTGSITAALNSGDDVWQGDYDEGEPDKFTVYGGYAYFWPMCDASNINKNAFMDYWKEAPSVDSDNDTLDQKRYDMIRYWLVWVVRAQIKNDGIRDENDGDFRMFQKVLSKAVIEELRTHGNKYKTQPKLNKLER